MRYNNNYKESFNNTLITIIQELVSTSPKYSLFCNINTAIQTRKINQSLDAFLSKHSLMINQHKVILF